MFPDSKNQLQKTVNLKHTTNDDRIYHFDEFPSITNLEYFPAEILIKIFDKLDDDNLINLSQASLRFRPIAQTILNLRYANEYLTLKSNSKENKQKFIKLKKFVGMNAAAIEVSQARKSDHWTIRELNKHAKHTKKIKFSNCCSIDIKAILSQHLNINQLTFMDSSGNITLPDLHCLTHFEFDSHHTYLDLSEYKRIMQNNPNIEYLKTNSMDAIKHISEYLSQLKELHITDKNDEFHVFEGLSTITMDSIEILTLPFSCDTELWHLFALKCKNVKKLEIINIYYNHDRINNDVFAAICSFSAIEILKLKMGGSIQHENMMMFEELGSRLANPFRLYLETRNFQFESDFILHLIHECRNAELIIIDFTFSELENNMYDPVRHCKNFHDEFLEITENRSPNVRIEFRKKGEIFGRITRKEFIWDSKLIYWIGFNAEHNHCGIHLFDLAKHSIDQHQQPFNIILDFLSIYDLYTLHQTSKECAQFVGKYITKRFAKEGKPFVVKSWDFDKDLICAFSSYISNIQVLLDPDDDCIVLWNLINEYCGDNLIKMCLFENCEYYKRGAITNKKFNFPNLQHFIYYDDYGDLRCPILFEISKLLNCTQLEKLEFKSDVKLMYNQIPYDSFIRLKEINFLNRNVSINGFLSALNPSVDREIGTSLRVQNWQSGGVNNSSSDSDNDSDRDSDGDSDNESYNYSSDSDNDYERYVNLNLIFRRDSDNDDESYNYSSRSGSGSDSDDDNDRDSD